MLTGSILADLLRSRPMPHDLLSRTALLILCIAGPLQAQRPEIRDSAGISIITSAAPALVATRALRIASEPTLVIGTGNEAAHQLSQVRGAARLADGSVVVADGGSTELRLFDAQGRFVRLLGRKGGGPGELRDLIQVVHLRGDTLAVVVGIGRAVYYDGSGDFLWNVDHYTSPADRGSTGPRAIVGAFGDGTTVILTVPRPRPRGRGERWMMTAPLARIIRRAWTPTRITGDDIDRYVVEWGERWIRSTGPEAERRRADLRDDPYERVVPAFSQFVADRAGRLWVRAPDLRDAPRAGQLNTMPLVPSTWSVFDRTGAWLCDVELPANFSPMEIGSDYVLAVVRDEDGVETVALYALLGE